MASTDATAIKQAVNFSYNNPNIGGDTNLPGGLIRAYNELQAHGRAYAPDFVVIITDGETNECSDLSGNRMYFREHAGSMDDTISPVPSVEPSSTTIISYLSFG